MVTQEPKYFYKIRCLENGEWVKPSTGGFGSPQNTTYAYTNTTGKTYNRLNDAMMALSLLAGKIASWNEYSSFDTRNDKKVQNEKRLWVFETTKPHFQLVKFEVKEVEIIDEHSNRG